MNRAWPSLQSGRRDFDAVDVPDLYDPGTDNLPFVIGKHFQLPLNQQFHVLEDVGEIAWGGSRIEAEVSFLVLLKLPLPDFGRTAGHVPGATGGVQTILPFANRSAHPKEASRRFRYRRRRRPAMGAAVIARGREVKGLGRASIQAS